MKKKLKPETVLRRNPNQLFSEVDGEIVMLSIDNGEYYNLNSTGSFIWYNLKKPCSVGNLVNKLTETYNVPDYICLNDILPFLEEFVDKKLVEIVKK